MSETLNVGNAILILGCLYFGYTYGFEWWLTSLILLSVGTWAYHGFTKERKKMFKAQIEMLQAKSEYYRRKSEK